MKNKNYLIIALLIVIVIISILFFTSNSKIETTDSKTLAPKENIQYKTVLAQEEIIQSEGNIEGVLVPAEIKTIMFAIDGKLEQGDKKLAPGAHFKFNDLLYKINMQEVFLSLSTKKSELKKTINDLLPEIAAKFPSEQNKWSSFANQLDPSKRLPDFPIINSTEERNSIKSTSIAKQYVKALQLENEIEKHFYLAPFDGIVVKVFQQPNSNIKKQTPIAKIAKRNTFQVEFDLASDVAKALPKVISFYSIDGKEIGNGKLLKKRGKSPGNTTFTFSFIKSNDYQPKFNDRIVMKNQTETLAYKLPKSAVHKNKVKVLSNNGLIEREIKIIREEQDSLFLTGLKNGEEIITHY